MTKTKMIEVTGREHRMITVMRDACKITGTGVLKPEIQADAGMIGEIDSSKLGVELSPESQFTDEGL